MTQTILVTGASGTVGRELSRLLVEAGATVGRATSRVAGEGQAHLDFVTGAGTEAALTGVDAVFLMSPPGHANQYELLGPVISAARTAGVRKVILMTAMGADADPTSPFRKLELQLETSGMAWNVIRPNWFMQNFNSYWLHGITHAGAIQLPTGDAKGSFIDTRDIAASAAALLRTSDHDNRAFDLTGEEALDHHEVARILSREADRTIRYEEVSPDAMRAGLLGAGLPAEYAEMMLGILGYFKLGYAERITDAVKVITGHVPRTFSAYAKDHRAAFVEAAVAH